MPGLTVILAAKSVGQDCGVNSKTYRAYFFYRPRRRCHTGFGYICSSGAAVQATFLETIDGLEHVFNGLGRLTKIRSS